MLAILGRVSPTPGPGGRSRPTGHPGHDVFTRRAAGSPGGSNTCSILRGERSSGRAVVEGRGDDLARVRDGLGERDAVALRAVPVAEGDPSGVLILLADDVHE